jgi:hypothetical protein
LKTMEQHWLYASQVSHHVLPCIGHALDAISGLQSSIRNV